MQRIPAGDVTTQADMQRIPAGHVTSYRQRSANGFAGCRILGLQKN